MAPHMEAAALRSADVVSASRSFISLMVPTHICEALAEYGVVTPSPVQHAALPLARLGADVIVQAKAGTGKTVVFAVAAVERVDLAQRAPQVLVLAPTREIALQGAEVVAAAGARLPPPGLTVGTFIGGLPVEEDQRLLRRTCHVAVGTPGRILSLISRGWLVTGHVRMLVLDEADKLLADNFRSEVLSILRHVPDRRQLLALSATYSPPLLSALRRLMQRPQEVLLCEDTTSLLAVKQFYKIVGEDGAGADLDHQAARAQAQNGGQAEQQPVKQAQQQRHQLDADGQRRGSGVVAAAGTPLWEAKAGAVAGLLSSISFQQAVVFCNRKADAESLAARLEAAGFPAAYLSADRSQLDRIDALNALRDYRTRVVVTTDLVARGVDLEGVNLVINVDLPADAATLMHRVGRAGRFGTRGLGVTLLAPGRAELDRLRACLQEVAGGEVFPLPDHVPEDWYSHHAAQTAQQAQRQAEQAAQQEEPGEQDVPPPPPPLPQQQRQQQEQAVAMVRDRSAANGGRHASLQANGGSTGGKANSTVLASITTASLWHEEPRAGLPEPTAPWARSPSASTLLPGRGTAAAAAEHSNATCAQPGDVPPPPPPLPPEPAALSSSPGRASELTAAVAAAARAEAAVAATAARQAAASSESDSWASSSDDVLTSSDDETPRAPRHRRRTQNAAQQQWRQRPEPHGLVASEQVVGAAGEPCGRRWPMTIRGSHGSLLDSLPGSRGSLASLSRTDSSGSLRPSSAPAPIPVQGGGGGMASAASGGGGASGSLSSALHGGALAAAVHSGSLGAAPEAVLGSSGEEEPSFSESWLAEAARQEGRQRARVATGRDGEEEGGRGLEDGDRAYHCSIDLSPEGTHEVMAQAAQEPPPAQRTAADLAGPMSAAALDAAIEAALAECSSEDRSEGICGGPVCEPEVGAGAPQPGDSGSAVPAEEQWVQAAAAAVAAAAPAGTHAGGRHFLQVIESARQDILSRLEGLGGADSSSTSSSGAGAAAHQRQAAVAESSEGQAGVARRRRLPLGSAQATAAMRRQAEEEAAAAAADDKEGEAGGWGLDGPDDLAAAAAYLEELAEQGEQEAAEDEKEEEQEGEGEAWSGTANPGGSTAEGAANEQAWYDYWMSYYHAHGCYPTAEVLQHQSSGASAPAVPAVVVGSPPLAPAAPPMPPPVIGWAGSEGGTDAAAAALQYQQWCWQEWRQQFSAWSTTWTEWQAYWEAYKAQQQQQHCAVGEDEIHVTL